jgi:hypothetical protein
MNRRSRASMPFQSLPFDRPGTNRLDRLERCIPASSEQAQANDCPQMFATDLPNPYEGRSSRFLNYLEIIKIFLNRFNEILAVPVFYFFIYK